jgi:hypothetical protein
LGETPPQAHLGLTPAHLRIERALGGITLDPQIFGSLAVQKNEMSQGGRL